MGGPADSGPGRKAGFTHGEERCPGRERAAAKAPRRVRLGFTRNQREAWVGHREGAERVLGLAGWAGLGPSICGSGAPPWGLALRGSPDSS